MTGVNRTDHIRLTSHPAPGAKPRFPIAWGAPSARERGPIIGTVSRPQDRNVIGTHSGSYAVYRALAVSAGALNPIRRPDLTNTHPAFAIGPFRRWQTAGTIVSLDPWGHLVSDAFRIRNCRRHRHPPQYCGDARAAWISRKYSKRLLQAASRHDGVVVHAGGALSVVKIAIDPVWYLPGIAERFGTSETNLRRTLFEQTAGMFPELVTRPDLQVFLPPVGGMTVYVFGDVAQAG